MSLQDAKDVVANCDPMVDDRFKNVMVSSIKAFQDNPTKTKLRWLLLNLPVGFFINQKELKCVADRPMGYRDLINMLLARDIKKLTEEPKNDI